MKIHLIKIIIVLALSSLFFYCERFPELPNTPKIKFENVIFKDLNNVNDSLIVSIGFEDGDGDLGLSKDDVDPPYNIFSYLKDSNGNYVKFSEGDIYNVNEWIIDTLLNLGNDKIADTLKIAINENHYNMFVDFLIKEKGEYKEFDWRKTYNLTFDGRFPILNDQGKSRPLEGSLRYGMASAGFVNLFRTDTLKLRLQIQDRALNRSNIVESADFTLDMIKQE